MWISITTLVAVFILTSCSSQPVPTEKTITRDSVAVLGDRPPETLDINLRDNEIEYAKKLASRELRDPESAQYRDIYGVQTQNGTRVVCGMVNAKNAYGGYVGFMPFSVAGDTAIVASQVSNSSAQAVTMSMIRRVCGDR